MSISNSIPKRVALVSRTALALEDPNGPGNCGKGEEGENARGFLPAGVTATPAVSTQGDRDTHINSLLDSEKHKFNEIRYDKKSHDTTASNGFGFVRISSTLAKVQGGR